MSKIKDKDDFANFLFEKISLLYIVVNAEKAVRTFTMMNGQKARMHDEELVKAEMLHIISLPEKDINLQAKTLEDTFWALKEVASIEWETNALRSKYAREWDRWLYWWNAKEVKDYFNSQKPMGLLLEYYYRIRTCESTFSFRNFKSLLPDNMTKQAKDVFKGLRDLQKQFEDVYNNPILHNYLKCALIGATGDADDKFDVIMYFIKNKRDYSLLNEYMKWRLIGSTHKEMTEDYTIELTAEDGKRDNKEKRKERALGMIKNLSKSHVYKVYDDLLYKQLLRLNVEEYNKLKDGKGVKFDFSIWNNKSLEHIYPKSKFYHIETEEGGQQVYVRGDGGIISQEEATSLLNSAHSFKNFSEHSIGNLVLLYGRNNSEFGNLPFDEKKKKFFNNERRFESRNLLHTISSFANSKWEPSDIETASRNLIARLAMDYHIDIKNIEEK